MMPLGVGFTVAFTLYFRDETDWPTLKEFEALLAKWYSYFLLVPAIVVGLTILFYVTHVEAVLPIGEPRVLIGRYWQHHLTIGTYVLCLAFVICMTGAAYLQPENFEEMKPLLGTLGVSAPALLVLTLRLLGHRRLNMREKQFLLTWFGILLPLMGIIPYYYAAKHKANDSADAATQKKLNDLTPYFIHVLCSSAAAFVLLMHTYVSVGFTVTSPKPSPRLSLTDSEDEPSDGVALALTDGAQGNRARTRLTQP